MSILRDVSLLVARLLVGVAIFAHGWQKFNDWTVAGVTKSFDGAGVPLPEFSAYFATYFEMAAGVLLVLGLFVRFVGPILALQMFGAFWFMHRGTEILSSNGGWELVGVFAAAGLALAAAGAGRFSVDYFLPGSQRTAAIN